MSEKVPITTNSVASDDGPDRVSFEKDARNKAGPSTTTTALLQEDDNWIADEAASCKPDKNLTAAIWTIVCGVALPCIPIIVVSIVLIWLVLSNSVSPRVGLSELRTPTEDTPCTGFIDCVSYTRHHAGPAWYVDANPSTITTIASWTSRVIPYLTSSIMALVAFFAARKIVTKSRDGSEADLPSPEQLTLLIGLLGGAGFEPLKDTIMHRWAHKTKLVDPIPLAFSALLVITLLGLLIPLVDTWFGIATVPASVTQLLSAAEHFQARSDSPWETNTTGILSTQPDYMCSRALNISLCPDGPGGFTAVNGSEWMACNIDFNENTPTGWLNGADGAVKVLQDVPSAPSNISTYPANYTAGNLNGQWDGPVYYYLDNPFTPRNLDYKAKTVAIATQCAPITSRCLSNDTWPYFDHMDFSCSPAFTANFSFDGLSQGTDIEGGFYNVDLWNPVGMAFSQDAQLRTRVGARDSSLEQTPPAYGNLTGFEYLYPQNPLHFAVWAMGYPALPGKDLNASVMPSHTLLSDHEVYRYGRNGGAAWVLNCSATVYDVTYTFVNGSVSRFDQELASPSMGGFISAPWTVSLWNDLRINALAAAATAGSATATSAQLATMFADHWSRSALALSAGAMEARPNLLTQFRSVVGPLARVPKVPFWTLLALKAIYVIAVILLAIGAYCFTHPAETEVVKAQLSTKGLAAAHFDTPDILQSKVVGQLSERLQPATKDMQVDVSDDPARGGLKRAATFLGEMPDKKVGVVARADGAWRFAVVTNGVWNGIAPVAVDLVAMESKAGHLGDAGDLVKAWIK